MESPKGNSPKSGGREYAVKESGGKESEVRRKIISEITMAYTFPSDFGLFPSGLFLSSRYFSYFASQT